MHYAIHKFMIFLYYLSWLAVRNLFLSLSFLGCGEVDVINMRIDDILIAEVQVHINCSLADDVMCHFVSHTGIHRSVQRDVTLYLARNGNHIP